jgi:hypothetical protein
MKQKVFSLIFSLSVFILSSPQAYGQVTMTVTTNRITPVAVNNDMVYYNAISLNITYRNIDEPNWSVGVRAQNASAILSDMSIQMNSVSGDGPSNPSHMNPVKRTLRASFQYVNNKIDWKLNAGSSTKILVITYDILINKSTYNALDPYETLMLGLDFSLYGSNDKPFAGPISTPPLGISPPPVHSIQVNLNASIGLLEFKSIGDYANGVSQTYTNGLSISSSTPYALQVKTQTSTFESATTASIPVGIVSLNLKESNGSLEGTVVLSNTLQTVFDSSKNTGRQGKSFSIRYFTAPNDPRLQNTKPDTYKATLLYTLIPL